MLALIHLLSLQGAKRVLLLVQHIHATVILLENAEHMHQATARLGKKPKRGPSKFKSLQISTGVLFAPGSVSPHIHSLDLFHFRWHDVVWLHWLAVWGQCLCTELTSQEGRAHCPICSVRCIYVSLRLQSCPFA